MRPFFIQRRCNHLSCKLLLEFLNAIGIAVAVSKHMLQSLSEHTINNNPDCQASASRKGGKIRTLLVDDQLAALAVLRNLLLFVPDIQVIGTASNGREAIEAINQLEPDLVFLDIEMPEIDGFGVVDAIAVKKMPIIVFVTGREDCATRALEAKALDYVTKPWLPSRLHSAIERVRQRMPAH